MTHVFEHFRHDLLFGLRMMGKQPMFNAAAVLALVIGIGFVIGQFTVLNGFLLRPLPLDEPDRLLAIGPEGSYESTMGHKPKEFSRAAFETYRENQQAFENVLGFYMGTINVSDGKVPRRYDGAFVTHNADETYRVAPVLGRGFEAADAEPGTEPRLLISHRAWMEDFSGDRGIVGKAILINSRPGRIIGVMPTGFHLPVREDAWMVLPAVAESGEGSMPSIEVIGRLHDGVSLDEAQLDGMTAMQEVARLHPDSYEEVTELRLDSIQRSTIGPITVKMLWVMMVSVFFILLIACANVANLLLARSAARGRELAIRSALGASRRRIVQQMLTESLVLCVLGALGGIIFSIWSIDWFASRAAQSDLPYWIEFSIDGRVLAFVCLVTVLSALISGAVPALKASSIDVNAMLKDGGRAVSALHIGVFTKGLIVAQISLSFALLILSGLMTQSVNIQDRMHLPIVPADVLAGRFSLFEGEYPEDGDVVGFARTLSSGLAAHQNVAGSSITTRMEFNGSYPGWFRTTGMPEEEPDVSVYTESVLPGYFDAIGAGVIAGRDFADTDTAESEAVVIVNESFVRRQWPEGPVLGRLVGIKRDAGEGHVWAKVVGVAPDLHMPGLENGLSDGSGYYLPFAQKPARFMTIVLRGSEGVAATGLTPILRRSVRAMDRNLPLYWVRTYQESIDRTLVVTRIVTSMFVIFGLAALLLAGMGIFAVVSFSISQRRSEIGIRMALGARISDIKALVVRQGFYQLLLGLGIGLVLSIGLSSMLPAFLAIRPNDAVTYLLATAILTLVSTAAGVLPARRAARVDPMVALRDE